MSGDLVYHIIGWSVIGGAALLLVWVLSWSLVGPATPSEWARWRAQRREERAKLRHDIKANYHQEWPGWDPSWLPGWKHHVTHRHMHWRKVMSPEARERYDTRGR